MTINPGSSLVDAGKSFVLDTTERVLRTALAAGSAALLADGTNLLSLSAWEGAGVAGYSAAATLVLSIFAKLKGDPASASFRQNG